MVRFLLTVLLCAAEVLFILVLGLSEKCHRSTKNLLRKGGGGVWGRRGPRRSSHDCYSIVITRENMFVG